MKNNEATARVVIENVSPVIDGGIYAIKRVPGEKITVEADIFGDGHDHVKALLLYKTGKDKKWKEAPMMHVVNDIWTGEFYVGELGYHDYAITAWIDHAETWQAGFVKKANAGEKMELELRIGAVFLKQMAKKAKDEDAQTIKDLAAQFDKPSDYQGAVELAKSHKLEKLIADYPLRENASQSATYKAFVERNKTLFSTWYEFFPRSASPDPTRTGTFKDCERIIPRLANMGYDTLYFPPIHPVGESFRKGKNNSTTSQPGEPGSPWAIGSKLGGHKAINPELGTLEDFKNLVKIAEEHNIEIALDIAYQCSPDHPYVTEHPQWFKWRPDGTVQYAENPPKKYQDVLPINFENDDWENLWKELKSVIEYWIGHGIKIFRVDNPHTKPFVFWEWLMADMRTNHPEVIFLSEAFTRPKIMAKLAKVGFQQSYSYFSWRQTKAELTEYLTELTKTELREYFRANFWPNTPDILPFYLQKTGYNHSAARFVLAATLSSNYGMYGPVYELFENEPMPGKEEYFNSEKYEARIWDWETVTPFHELIAKINHIRIENEAFHSTYNIEFCETDNVNLIAFFKQTYNGSNRVLTIINLDPNHKQSGWVKMPLNLLEVQEGHTLKMNDLMDGTIYNWNRQWNYIELDPRFLAAHIFKITLK